MWNVDVVKERVRDSDCVALGDADSVPLSDRDCVMAGEVVGVRLSEAGSDSLPVLFLPNAMDENAVLDAAGVAVHDLGGTAVNVLLRF